MKKPNHNIFWFSKVISYKDNKEKSVDPKLLYITKIANNIGKLPAKVYKKNK
jgi:hypothetical protein